VTVKDKTLYVEHIVELGHHKDSTFSGMNVHIDQGLNKGRGRILNFPGAPPLFKKKSNIS
jgi:hypothetical protein